MEKKKRGPRKYRRKVTEHGIYLNGLLYDNPKLRPYLGRNLILLSDGSNWEVYTFDSVFICSLRKNEGIRNASCKNRNWGGMKAMSIK